MTKISDWLLIARNREAWKRWQQKVNGIKTRDFKRGCGYYLTIGLIGYSPIGKVVELQCEGGKIAICELIDYETFGDPFDMVKESWWCLIGYKGIKAAKDCSFREFLALYIQN
jgi:hypothetical protein